MVTRRRRHTYPPWNEHITAYRIECQINRATCEPEWRMYAYMLCSKEGSKTPETIHEVDAWLPQLEMATLLKLRGWSDKAIRDQMQHAYLNARPEGHWDLHEQQTG